jgi:hypothetical protein
VRALAFEAVLAGLAPEPVLRTIAMREDQTLGSCTRRFASRSAGLEVLGPGADEYTAPFEIEEMGKDKRSARTPIAELGSRKGRTLAYVFDFGDEWRLLLKVEDVWEACAPAKATPSCSRRTAGRAASASTRSRRSR